MKTFTKWISPKKSLREFSPQCRFFTSNKKWPTYLKSALLMTTTISATTERKSKNDTGTTAASIPAASKKINVLKTYNYRNNNSNSNNNNNFIAVKRHDIKKIQQQQAEPKNEKRSLSVEKIVISVTENNVNSISDYTQHSFFKKHIKMIFLTQETGKSKGYMFLNISDQVYSEIE